MQKLERFLRSALFPLMEELEVFDEVKVLSITKKTVGSSKCLAYFYPDVFLMGDTLRVCGGFCAEHL